MKLRMLCAALAVSATVLASGCATTARRYPNPPTVVGYSPVAAQPAGCCPNPAVVPPPPAIVAPPPVGAVVVPAPR